MAHRQKNLLEAFSASAAVDKAAAADEDGLAPAPAPEVAGARKATDAEPRPAPPLLDTELSAPPGVVQTLLQPENRGGLVILLVLGLALAFLTGRASVGSVVAQDDAAAPDEVAAATNARAGLQPQAVTPVPTGEPLLVQPQTPAELALADLGNRYTVKLVEYRLDRDEDLCWANLAYLEELGLPAAVVMRGERMFIVLGAAPTVSELDDLVHRAQTMRGPPPRNEKAEFADAYVERIDKLYKRANPTDGQ
jgi:hypothetical protein